MTSPARRLDIADERRSGAVTRELFYINKIPELPMPTPTEYKRKHGREVEEKALELVQICTQALFRSRETLTESCFDHSLRTCKRVVRRTSKSDQIRNLIGIDPQQWKDMHLTFSLAIPVLEAQSLAADDPQNGAPASGTHASSSALMALNHDTLMKDLERLNDILLIARNVLASSNNVQDIAAENLVDQQVMKLVDLCVRVTARGYDGDAGSRTELQWGDVIGSYKKLLITCIQFLFNFIQENEQRKLLLWLDLFANSKVQNEYAAGTLAPGMRREHFAVKPGDAQGKAKASVEPVKDAEPQQPSPDDIQHGSKVIDGNSSAEVQVSFLDSRESLLQDIDEVTESVEPMERMSVSNNKADVGKNLQTEGQEMAQQDATSKVFTLRQESAASESGNAASQNELLFRAVKGDHGDELGAVRTPESAAVVLQAAKDQLMARLADTATGTMTEEESDLIPFPNDGDSNGQGPSPSDDDEEYRSPGEPGDQERGLLTNIPLVLGPQEIEPLACIIQIAICSAQGAVLHGRDMQGMRCNILLAGDPGRNLLRELLIFIAAWDLQDDETYFKLMMQIMEAILENGLMPYAYQTFAEVKDIVSPAQSMVIKILTQIFRGKQGQPPIKGKVEWTAGNAYADSSRRVDIYIVRYIFTIFRQCIIPETCALIYLQGQIKAGLALPEDFPLNLWDMERVYEGVYQFLEFFAVLTESEEWKDLLVNWEIVNELVTLLRELEASIPKAPLSVPQTIAEAQQAAEQQQHQQTQPASLTPAPAPVAVERPLDVAPPLHVVERPFDVPPPADAPFAAPSPLSQTDSQDQVENDAADPSDFEWRNLKKLVILVLSSLVWKSPTVQKQIRQYGGVQMVLACCTYDGNNPYIREHAVMCLRFLLENSEENKELVRGLERVNVRNGQEGSGILPTETAQQQGHAHVGAQVVQREEE